MAKYAVMDMDITVMFQGMFQGMPSGLNIQLWNIFTMKYNMQENGKQHWHCMFRGPTWEVEYFNKENKLSKVLRLKFFDELIMHQSR